MMAYGPRFGTDAFRVQRCGRRKINPENQSSRCIGVFGHYCATECVTMG